LSRDQTDEIVAILISISAEAATMRFTCKNSILPLVL
jgi:hypothetical protein